MVQLSDYEKGVLAGKEGRLKQVCLENIVRYAEILGSEELCEVTKATVFCGAHNYLNVSKSDDVNEVFSQMNLAVEEIIPFDQTYENCTIQSCLSPCDQYEYHPFAQSGEFFKKNAQFLEQARRAGVIITGTCAPYLTGWLPVRGEHFVTTESGVTVIGNSIWGCVSMHRRGRGRPVGGGSAMDKITIKGRGVIAGIVEGEALVCPKSITGWGGIDPQTGIIKEYENVNRGKSIRGKILIMPGSKGSNGWSCYFGAARVAGAAPLGWVFTRIDSSACVATAVLQIPTVVDFEEDQDPCTLIKTGDRVRIDGQTGVVEIFKTGGATGEHG